MRLPTEPVPRWMQGRDALGWVTVVIGGLVVASLIYLVVLIPTGTSAIPLRSTGDQRLQELTSLQSAAQQELTALYAFDYKVIDQTVSKVAAGSSGDFNNEWQSLAVTFKAGATQLQVHATANIAALSVHQIKGDTATLLAAVSQVKSNTDTKSTKATALCPAGSVCGYYHLWVTYQRVGGQWKMSNLEYFNE